MSFLTGTGGTVGAFVPNDGSYCRWQYTISPSVGCVASLTILELDILYTASSNQTQVTVFLGNPSIQIAWRRTYSGRIDCTSFSSQSIPISFGAGCNGGADAVVTLN
jgi:hypothetical protein